jgi:hypothetical protein
LTTGAGTIVAGSNLLTGVLSNGDSGTNIRYSRAQQCKFNSDGTKLYVLDQGNNILSTLSISSYVNSNIIVGVSYSYDFCIDPTYTYIYYTGYLASAVIRYKISDQTTSNYPTTTYPLGITVDNSSNLYVFTNATLLKINTQTGVNTIIAGTGTSGSIDGPLGISRINIDYTSKIIYNSNNNSLYWGEANYIRHLDLNSSSYNVTKVTANLANTVLGMAVQSNTLYYTTYSPTTIYSVPISSPITPAGPTNGILYPAATNWSGNSALSILYAPTSNTWALY